MAGQKFSLGGEIGNGAVGIVRKATRLSDGVVCAVKFLAPDPKYIDVSKFDDVSARFKREGAKGAKLSHPCLLRILGAEENASGSAFVTRGPLKSFHFDGVPRKDARELHPRPSRRGGRKPNAGSRLRHPGFLLRSNWPKRSSSSTRRALFTETLSPQIFSWWRDRIQTRLQRYDWATLEL